MEAVEPTRPIIMRRGGLQQQQQQQEDRSSTWSPFAFAPSWIQTGIQSLKQSVFGPSNPLGQQQQETQGSLLGKRSEPADDRDYGPTPKRPRLQSPPAQARSDSMEAQPNSVLNEATEPIPHTRMPTLPRTHAVSQTVHRSSPVTGPIPGRPLGPVSAQNYLPNASTSRRHRLGALSGRPATATFASNNAIPPRATSQVGLGREYSFQGYRALSSGPPSGTETDRTSPSRQQPTVARPKQPLRAPSFGPNPVRTPKSGHLFGKPRDASPTKPTLDRPAGTGWASGIVRTERDRNRLGSFANIPYEATRPPVRDYTKLVLDPQADSAAPWMPMSIDPPRLSPVAATTNGPAHRALNMLSEMSTPLSNARASPSLAPFTTIEIPPVQARRVKVPIPAPRAVAARKQKEVKDTIAALRAKAQTAPYPTVHPSTTPSRKILGKRREDEPDNNEDDSFEFVVEPLRKGKGKENAKPAPSPALLSSPSAAAAIVSPIEKEEKQKDEEREKSQDQTQETTAVTATTVRASTPSIRTAGTLKFPTGSLAGGAAPSGIRVAHSFRPTRETQFRTHAPAARIGGRFTANLDDDEDADEGAPTKEDLEQAAKNVPAINVPVGFKLSFGKEQSSSTPPASTLPSTPLAPPTKHLVEVAVQASPTPEFKAHIAPISPSASAPKIVLIAPTAAPSPANVARVQTPTPPARDEEMGSGSPVKESAPQNEDGKSKPAETKLFDFPAIGSIEAPRTTSFGFGALPAPSSTPEVVPAPTSASATSTGGFRFNLPTPTTATAEPPKGGFPFGVTSTPVPSPVEPKPAPTPFIFGAPPQAAPAAAPKTTVPASTPSPDKRPGFSFIAPASTTPAETPSKPPPLYTATPGTVTPTNKLFSFNAPSSAALSEADSSPIKPDSASGFSFTSASTPLPATTNPFAFGAPPGSIPSPDSRASTPAAPATGGFTFSLPGVTGVQPVNNPFVSKTGAVTDETSTAFSFTNASAAAATPAKPFTFGAVPSTTPAGPPPSSSTPFQFGAPPSAPAASTAPFGRFGTAPGAGSTRKPVLQLDIDMDKDSATPPQEPARSNTPFAFGAPSAASNSAFGSAPPSAHPFGQTAPSSPFNAPSSSMPFGAAPSTKAPPFGQPPAVAGTGTGSFSFNAPGSNVSTPVTGTFPNLRAQTGSPAASPFNPPAQLFGAPAPGTPTNFPSNLSETGSDVGERRIKPLPKSRKARTQSETRNALAKFHSQKF